jgi:flagellar motor protein MotB
MIAFHFFVSRFTIPQYANPNFAFLDTNMEDTTNTEQTTASDDASKTKPATTQEDTEMTEDTKLDTAAPTAEGSAEPTVDTPASASKAASRRKSGGAPEHKGKKLNKKASKAKMTHIDAQPGDYFYVRLKGYPLWPAIVCDESMLPTTLITSRPVTAARPDGTYRADFEDGGSKAKDRTFPVMYLHTNEL